MRMNREFIYPYKRDPRDPRGDGARYRFPPLGDISRSRQLCKRRSRPIGRTIREARCMPTGHLAKSRSSPFLELLSNDSRDRDLGIVAAITIIQVPRPVPSFESR